MKLNILIVGHAGQGPNALAKIIGNVLAKHGYYAFISRDYGSFIRGGVNANKITFSDKPLMSNESRTDVVVVLEKEMKNELKKEIKQAKHSIVNDDKGNMYFAGVLAKLFGIELKELESELKKLKNYDTNIKDAKKGYSESKTKVPLSKLNNKAVLMDGSAGVAEGAIKSGLDIYLGYPMTPATPLLGELAEKQIENNYIVIEPESEIAAINAAIGSAITGAKSMTGTSGGGFDLMTEALSEAGQAEVPLVIYLAQRGGPSTGVPTYTSQSDLNLALYSGHGDFPRLVIAPGDPIECQELTSHAFYLSQKYKIPAIILSDKHLAESIFSLSAIPNITQSEKSTNLVKYNSYEHDKNGIATDNAKIIAKNAEARLKKSKDISKEAEKFNPFKIYGKKDSQNAILFWGSTKGALLDAAEGMNAKMIQVLYMEPFTEKLKSEIKKAKNVFIVENNSTSQLSQLIAQKTGIIIPEKNRILKYDCRPFFSDELKTQLKKLIR